MSFLKELKEEQHKLIMWVVAFVGVVILIALNKVPASTIEYVLFWIAGAAGGMKGGRNEAK